MTKRELFAAMAFQAVLMQSDAVSKGCVAAVAESLANGKEPSKHVEITAAASVAYADALLAELEKSK